MDGPQQILRAIAAGVVGNPDVGLARLQPIVDRGPGATYNLLCVLAEAASHIAREGQQPSDWFAIEVREPDGRGASTDVLSPPVRFAVQFVTAWANRDRGTAYDLFLGIAEHAERTRSSDLAVGIQAVYEMAVITAREVAQRDPRQR